MTGVGGATILLSLLLVRILMVKRLSRLTSQLLSMRHDQLTGRRLRVDHGPLGQRDEISVLAEEFDALLDALSATTRQLTDVSRSEEHPSELQSLMLISYAVFCLTKQKT